MYLMSVLTSPLWAFFLFFHTVISPYFLSCCSAHLPRFYLVLLNFLPLLSVSCSVRFYSKQFFLMWGFCPESEIQYTHFDSLLGQDCFSTTRPYCCQFALTLELDSIAYASSFCCCSYLSPLHLLLGKSESCHLKLWESLLPSLCFSLDCFWFHRDPIADITVMVVHPHLFIFWSSWGCLIP